MHPWLLLWTTIKQQGRTQKQFALLVWKKVSEVNELIKGKRNITIQRDYLLHNVLWTPLKHRINIQRDYDYELFLSSISPEQQKEQQTKQHDNQTKETSIDRTDEDWFHPSKAENSDDTPLSEEQILQEKKQIFKDF